MFSRNYGRCLDIGSKFLQVFLRLTISTLAMFSLTGSQPAALAETDGKIVLEIPVFGQAFSINSVLLEAESLARDAINQQFAQNPALEVAQVLVMASRNGEIVPVLETNVSRAQWLEQADVRLWSRYFQSSYALLGRHDDQPSLSVARANMNRSVGSRRNSIRNAAQIDAAVDSGRLSGSEIQQVLGRVD